MSDHYALLDIPVSPFRDDFVMPRGDCQQSIFQYSADEILNPSLIDFFRSINLNPVRASIFHHAPYVDMQPIHTDGAVGEFRAAINWIFCDDYVMRWYKPRDGIEFPTTPKDAHVHGELKSTPFLKLEKDDAIVIDETRDKGPILVNIGTVFHHSINLSDTDRWALTVRFEKGSMPSWNACLDKLAPWLVKERNNHEKSN